jgi:2-oxoglutarate ferredoxin oxidoreductase subunit alpha
LRKLDKFKAWTRHKRNPEKNIEVARRGHDYAKQLFEIKRIDRESLPLLTGNEAIALGAISAGLEYYFAYPMTPSTSILHYLAGIDGINTIHPENEVAVILMSLGASYAGAKTMIASSGGGFALMVEGLSLAGQAEIPIVVVISQRAGPSTGSPTYTMQADLHFVLNAGHGEFPGFVTAPGDAEQAYKYTALAMKIAWKYQIPALVLGDKHLSESLFSFEYEEVCNETYRETSEVLWKGKGEYQRYELTDDGVSQLAFPGANAVVKVNSYDHLENGITTESPDEIEVMHDKRKKKLEKLRKEVEKLDSYYVYDFSNGGESKLFLVAQQRMHVLRLQKNLK